MNYRSKQNLGSQREEAVNAGEGRSQYLDESELPPLKWRKEIIVFTGPIFSEM